MVNISTLDEIFTVLTIDYIRDIAASMVPESNPGDFNQAMMELGARICTPQSPDCVKCPISDDCKAFNQLKYVKELSKNGFFDEKKKKRKMADTEHGKKNRFMFHVANNLCFIHRLFRLS